MCWEGACLVPGDKTQLRPLLKGGRLTSPPKTERAGLTWKTSEKPTDSVHLGRGRDSAHLTSSQVTLPVPGPELEQPRPGGQPR